MLANGSAKKWTWVLLGALLCGLLVWGVQAAETYQFVTKWGTEGTGDGQFLSPEAVAIDSGGNVYVTDPLNNRVEKFTSGGQYILGWGSKGLLNGQFNQSNGIAVDATGNVYVTDRYNHRVQKFTSSGTFLTAWGSFGTGNGQFNDPFAVAVDSLGNVYVTDHYNHRVQKFSPSGQFITAWGSYGNSDGQFNIPLGIAVDASDNVYVVDYNTYRIQKFTSSGQFITKWEGPAYSGESGMKGFIGITVDSEGYVYVSELWDSHVYKFSPAGTLLTQLGTPGQGDGQFSNPISDIAVDSHGNVYLVDRNNGRVQKFAPITTVPTFTVTGITPFTAQNSGPVSIIDLNGSGFPSVVSVKLTRPGSLAITATGITIRSPQKITCTFDLTGRDVGAWDVVVTKPDGQSATLPNGFIVTAQHGSGLTVTSSPSGADIFIDGVQVGTTPATFANILPGAHSITVTKIGYYGYYSDITVASGESSAVAVSLLSLGGGTGTISVRSDPAGGSITFDGVATGKTTPFDFYEIPSGDHTISISMVGYGTYAKKVAVNAGATVVVTTSLSYIPSDGVVFISSIPTGATIYIDDKPMGVTDTSLHLAPGRYILKLTKDKYVDDISDFSIGAGDAIQVTKTLKTPGFECVLAIISVFAVFFIVRKRKN
jgi:streptogramin lyase